MDSGKVQIYYGDGRGKSTAALGYALQTATAGKNVFVIHFLKGKMATESAFMQRLEPEIKLFHFEKLEENRNLRNGVNFARKVLMNDECNLLVLDELLGVIDNGIVTKEDVEALFRAKADGAQIIVTGRKLPDYMRELADEIYEIQTEKSGNRLTD